MRISTPRDFTTKGAHRSSTRADAETLSCVPPVSWAKLNKATPMASQVSWQQWAVSHPPRRKWIREHLVHCCWTLDDSNSYTVDESCRYLLGLVFSVQVSFSLFKASCFRTSLLTTMSCYCCCLPMHIGSMSRLRRMQRCLIVHNMVQAIVHYHASRLHRCGATYQRTRGRRIQEGC